MVAGVSFKNVKNAIKDVTLRKRTNLSLQSTKQFSAFLGFSCVFPGACKAGAVRIRNGSEPA